MSIAHRINQYCNHTFRHTFFLFVAALLTPPASHGQESTTSFDAEPIPLVLGGELTGKWAAAYALHEPMVQEIPKSSDRFERDRTNWETSFAVKNIPLTGEAEMNLTIENIAGIESSKRSESDAPKVTKWVVQERSTGFFSEPISSVDSLTDANTNWIWTVTLISKNNTTVYNGLTVQFDLGDEVLSIGFELTGTAKIDKQHTLAHYRHRQKIALGVYDSWMPSNKYLWRIIKHNGPVDIRLTTGPPVVGIKADGQLSQPCLQMLKEVCSHASYGNYADKSPYVDQWAEHEQPPTEANSGAIVWLDRLDNIVGSGTIVKYYRGTVTLSIGGRSLVQIDRRDLDEAGKERVADYLQKKRSEKKLEKSDDRMRVWKSGNYSTTASLISTHNGVARLRLKSGKTVDVPISKLCEEDRDYVAGFNKAD